MTDVDDDVQAILDDTDEPLERKVVGLPPLQSTTAPGWSPGFGSYLFGATTPPTPEELTERRRRDALAQALDYGRRLRWTDTQVVEAARAFEAFIVNG